MCMDRHTKSKAELQTGSQVGMMKLINTFHSFANMPKKGRDCHEGNFGSPVLLTFCPECTNIKLHYYCC
jgi:hypothetical protein